MRASLPNHYPPATSLPFYTPVKVLLARQPACCAPPRRRRSRVAAFDYGVPVGLVNRAAPMKLRHVAGNGSSAIPPIHMIASALTNNEVLALPEPGNDEYPKANRTICAVLNLLGARIERITDCYVTAEIQPDVFIFARLCIYGAKRGMINWTPLYANKTFADQGCYLAADRPVEALARDVRRRVYPAAITYCKEQREYRRKTRQQEIVEELRRAQLEAVMGKLEDRENEIISRDFSLKLSKYTLKYPEASISAIITVRNWHCFLMIAKLLAEDGRLAE